MEGEKSSGQIVKSNLNNEEAEQRSKYALRGILANKYPPPYSYADYRAYCLTELSHDNVDFYTEASSYRTEALKRFAKINSPNGAEEEPQQPMSNQGSRYLDSDKLKSGLQTDYSSQQNLAHQQQTKQLEESDRQYLSYILQDLSRSYIQPGSPKEINLSQVVRSRLIQYILDGNNLHPDILLPAMNKTFEMMKTESYPRFLRAILTGQYKSDIPTKPQTSNIVGASSGNLFHENVEIVFPNKQEKELKEVEQRHSKEIISSNNDPSAKKTDVKKKGGCCIIQ